MNQKQKEARERIIKRYGKEPISEYENTFLKCYFLEYPFITIGIEEDGYAHS